LDAKPLKNGRYRKRNYRYLNELVAQMAGYYTYTRQTMMSIGGI